MPFGARLAAAQEIAFSQDPDDLAVLAKTGNPLTLLSSISRMACATDVSRPTVMTLRVITSEAFMCRLLAAASLSAATPGSSRPSSHSRKAPPAVET